MSRIDGGSLFHAVEPATEKALELMSVLVGPTWNVVL